MLPADDIAAGERFLVKTPASSTHPVQVPAAPSITPPQSSPLTTISTVLTAGRTPSSSLSSSAKGGSQSKLRSKAPGQKVKGSQATPAAPAAPKGAIPTDSAATVKATVPASNGAFTSGEHSPPFLLQHLTCLIMCLWSHHGAVTSDKCAF